MGRSNEKFEDLKTLVLNKLKNTDKSKAIKSATLCQDLNISFRVLKRLITSLRDEYPIVSKDNDGGGYWMASNEDDILNFINMMNVRKRSYEDTINKMNRHLKEM